LSSLSETPVMNILSPLIIVTNVPELLFSLCSTDWIISIYPFLSVLIPHPFILLLNPSSKFHVIDIDISVIEFQFFNILYTSLLIIYILLIMAIFPFNSWSAVIINYCF
jgi:hypothetical protein